RVVQSTVPGLLLARLGFRSPRRVAAANLRLALSLRSARAKHCASLAPRDTRFSLPKEAASGGCKPAPRFFAAPGPCKALSGVCSSRYSVFARQTAAAAVGFR